MNKIFGVIAATVLAFSFLSSAQAKPIEAPKETKVERFIVKNDGGGSVKDFMAALSYMKKNDMKVRLEGYCASACTLLLSTDYNIDVCVTPDVKLGFHSPYYSSGFGIISHKLLHVVEAERMWREDFYAKYPEWTKTMIDAAGGVPSVNKGAKPDEVLWLSYPEIRTYIKTCI